MEIFPFSIEASSISKKTLYYFPTLKSICPTTRKKQDSFDIHITSGQRESVATHCSYRSSSIFRQQHLINFSVFIEYNEFNGQCFCLSKFNNQERLITANLKCTEIIPNNYNLKKNINTLYQTGYIDFGNHLEKHRQTENNNQIAIIFFLTVGGRRNLRQIKRLIRIIYSRQHYYLIHVDSVCIRNSLFSNSVQLILCQYSVKIIYMKNYSYYRRNFQIFI